MSQFSPLYNHCIFQTHEKTESHTRVATELADHVLTWHGNVIDTRFCKLNTPLLSLYSLRYGSEIDIHPDVYDDFSLVHFSLSGGIEVAADGNTWIAPQGRVLVSTPKKKIDLHWSHDAEQLILRLPHDLIDEVARQMGRHGLPAEIDRTPGFLLPVEAGELWRSQLTTFVALEEAKHRMNGLRAWQSHFEQSIVMFLLLQLSSTATKDQADEKSRPFSRSPKQLERLYRFASSHLDKPVTLTAMARAVALSERQLNTFCHSEFGVSPIAWLRGQRLDAIRSALLRDPTLNLSDIAMLHGFFHLGRFSAFYRERFGELPRQTRKSARSG